MKTFFYKLFFASFPKGDPSNDDILKFHLRLFHQYQFRNADIATLDGKPLDDDERSFIASLPMNIKGTCMVYGEPDEKLFIEDMIHEIEPMKLDLPGKLMVKADNYLKFLKIRKIELTRKKTGIKKPIISDIRARAFCIALMQESGKMNFLKGSVLRKNDIMKFAKDTWGKNGRTVYDECLNIISENNPINKWYKEDNPKEYELGFKLYKEMFPD